VSASAYKDLSGGSGAIAHLWTHLWPSLEGAYSNLPSLEGAYSNLSNLPRGFDPWKGSSFFLP
jgi:hypothetical protein